MSDFQNLQKSVYSEKIASAPDANLFKCSICVERLKPCHLNNEISKLHGISWKSIKICKRQLIKLGHEISGKHFECVLIPCFITNSFYNIL